MTASLQLNGCKELQALLETYPQIVIEAAARTGLRKAGRKLRASIQVPHRTGRLDSAVKVRGGKVRGTSARLFVGLSKARGERVVRSYYKTLEMPSRRGGPLRPFLLQPYLAQKEALAQLIIDETRNAVYAQARRIHRKTLAKNKAR